MPQFFILGNPRSGTSLLRLMLNTNSNIVVPPECGFLQWWYLKYKYWSISDSENIEIVTKYVVDIQSSKKIEGWKLLKSKLKSAILKNKPKNYAELSTLVYLEYSKDKKKENAVIGDKNNYYIHHLPILAKIYPDAIYIHLIRDGRDVACSYREINRLKTTSPYKPKVTSSIENIAMEWADAIERIDSFIGTKKHIRLRYEDLVNNPSEELLKVCEFLGTPFEDNMLSYYQKKNNDEPDETIDWKMKTLSPIDDKNINKYLKILSKQEISEFNKIAKEVLMKNEYL